jgi:WD40 repeat protein
MVVIQAIEKANTPVPDGLVLKGHKVDVVCLDISRDGRLAVSGGNDNLAIVWDLRTGEQLRRLEGIQGKVWGVSLSPDGKQVLVGTQSGNLSLHEVGTGKVVRSFARQTKAVRCVSFLSDGKRAVTANYDLFVRLLDVENTKELKQFAGHTGNQLSLATSPNDRYALTGGGVKGTRGAFLWDIEKGEKVHELGGHGERILGCAFSTDSKTCATSSWDGKIRIWDVATGQLLRTLTATTRLFGLAFSPDGKTLAAGEESGAVTLWDHTTGKAIRTLEGHTKAISQVRYSQDGKVLISGSKDGTVRVWKMQK